MLPDYETYKKQFEERRNRMDQEYQAAGYIRVGNQYVKDPNFMSPSEEVNYARSLNALEEETTGSDVDYDAIAAAISENPDLFSELPAEVKVGVLPKLPKQATAKVGKDKAEKPNDTQIAFTQVQSAIPLLMKNYNEKGDLKGIGAGGTGRIASLLYNLGIAGDDEGEDNRIAIGQIRGAISKLRAGTALTPTEERNLTTYTPDINDSPRRVQRKLAFLQNTLADLDGKYNFLGGGSTTTTVAPGGGQAPADTNDPLGLRR